MSASLEMPRSNKVNAQSENKSQATPTQDLVVAWTSMVVLSAAGVLLAT